MPCSPPLALCCKVRSDGADYGAEELPPPRLMSIRSTWESGFYSFIGATNAVNALHLEGHLAESPALSSLNIRGEVGLTTIRAVDRNLMLLSSYLTRQSSLGSYLTNRSSPGSYLTKRSSFDSWFAEEQSSIPPPPPEIYLIYDSDEESIGMIPTQPWSQGWGQRNTAVVTSILIVRPSGDDRSYALVSMAEKITYSGHNYNIARSQDFLYLWLSSCKQWRLIEARFPPEFKGDNVAHSYLAVVTFSCGGRAFWANLERGIMYCSIDSLLSASSSSGPSLEFGYIKLPVELSCPVACSLEQYPNAYRTVGRVGESIKFITIDGFIQCLDFVNCTLRVWSMSPDEHAFKTEHNLCLGSLANQDAFKNAGLPTNMVPMYPNVSTDEEDVIYIMLGKYDPCCEAHECSKVKCDGYLATAGRALYHLRVDVRHGVLLSSAHIPHLFAQNPPSVILAGDLFGASLNDSVRRVKRRRV